jgi:hypothetical protein
MKRLGLGLDSVSLGRTYDDLMLVSGVTLPLLQTELVRRESHDDLERYQAFMAQERGAENVKKPQHPSAKVLLRSCWHSRRRRAPKGRSMSPRKIPRGGGIRETDGSASRGRGRGRGGTARSGGTSQGRGAGGDVSEDPCKKCRVPGHVRTRYPKALEKANQDMKGRKPTKARRARGTATG